MPFIRQVCKISNSSYHLLSTYHVPKIMPNLHIIPSLYPNNPMTHALILPEKLAVAQPAGDHTVSGGAGGWDVSPGVYDSRAVPPPHFHRRNRATPPLCGKGGAGLFLVSSSFTDQHTRSKAHLISTTIPFKKFKIVSRKCIKYCFKVYKIINLYNQ